MSKRLVVARAFAAICAFAVFLAFNSEPAQCAQGSENNPVVGRWAVVRVGSRDATKLPIKIEWEFTKEEVIVRDLSNSQETSRNRYKIDNSKEPKWITATVVDQATEIREGIFRIVGDELHLKQTIGGGPRPTGFAKDGFSILKRQPKQKATIEPNARHPFPTVMAGINSPVAEADAAEKSDHTAIRTLLKQLAGTIALRSSAPKGHRQTSPGQRPGYVVPPFCLSPVRAEQHPAICSALSGRVRSLMTFPRGVAPGWFVGAPSARSLQIADATLQGGRSNS